MQVGVVKELMPGERRVAIVPKSVEALRKAGLKVVAERDCGLLSGFNDQVYRDAGAEIVDSREAVYQSDIVVQVRGGGAQGSHSSIDKQLTKPGQTIVAMMDPLGEPGTIREFATTGANLFSLELIPRITRAQSMDILSSQATIAGYRAVLLAAIELPKLFPMMMTAAGTLTAAKVFVIGVGVAGLQAIATARKLGAVVQAYDVRPACREQVESLGGKFVQLQLDNNASEDKSGYAMAMDEVFYNKQRELLTSVVKNSDVVITTAAIPGKKSPVLVTEEAIQQMAPGSVIVDLGAERGGNCELTVANQRTVVHGVTILGPTNISSDTPNHSSQMFSNNVTKFLLNMIKAGDLELNLDDEIIRETLVARNGLITNPRISSLLSDSH